MDKKVLLKKIKRKFFSNKEENYKYFYKKCKTNYDFLKGVADTRTLKPLQGRFREYQLNMLDFCNGWFEKFKEINVSYFLIAGNLLGAYRNGGFIPWDDDFDIGMMRERFENLLIYLRKNYREIPVDKIFYSPDNRSEIIREYVEKYPDETMFALFPTHLQILCGEKMASLNTLDIHPYDFYRDGYTPEEYKKYIEFIREKRKELNNYSEINNFFKNERENNPDIVEKSDTIYFGIDNYDSYYLEIREFFKASDILPLKTVDFEGKIICAPNNIEKYLVLNYGNNYMEMPENISVNSHIAYRTASLKIKKQKKQKEISTEKNRILKKLKRRFFINKTEKYKELYKEVKTRAEIMHEITNIEHLKPCHIKPLREYQLKTVDFCKKMTDFLEEHGLEYFITSGTLIGAVRHKGFVPWDDDFDVGMMRKDYEKLKEILHSNFKEIDLSAASYKKWNQYDIIDNALKKSGGEITFLIHPMYIQIYHGTSFNDCLYLDVFSHEYYRNDYTKEDHKIKSAEAQNIIDRYDKYGLIMNEFEKMIASDKDIKEESDVIYYGIDSYGTFIVNPTNLMSKEMIFPRKKMVFEGYEFYAPNDPDGYIKVQYPNYMNFPSNITVAPDWHLHITYKNKGNF